MMAWRQSDMSQRVLDFAACIVFVEIVRFVLGERWCVVVNNGEGNSLEIIGAPSSHRPEHEEMKACEIYRADSIGAK